MDRRILKRIEELKERLYALRAHRPDSTTLIAIQAIEQELTQTAFGHIREKQLQEVLQELLQDRLEELIVPHRLPSKEKTKSGGPRLPRTCGKSMEKQPGMGSSAGRGANDRAPPQLMR